MYRLSALFKPSSLPICSSQGEGHVKMVKALTIVHCRFLSDALQGVHTSTSCMAEYNSLSGASNMVCGLCGAGFTGSYIFSQTIFSMRANVTSKWHGAIIAGMPWSCYVSFWISAVAWKNSETFWVHGLHRVEFSEKGLLLFVPKAFKILSMLACIKVEIMCRSWIFAVCTPYQCYSVHAKFLLWLTAYAVWSRDHLGLAYILLQKGISFSLSHPFQTQQQGIPPYAVDKRT